MLVQNLLTQKQIEVIKNVSYKTYINLLRFQSKKLHQLLTQLEYQVYSSPNSFVIFGTIMYNKDCDEKIRTVLDFLNCLKTKINSFVESEYFDFLIYSIELHKGYKLFLKKKDNNSIDIQAFINETTSLFGYPHVHFLIKTNLNCNENLLKKIYQNMYINGLYEKFKGFDCNFQIIKQNETKFYLKKKFLYIIKEIKLNESFYEDKYMLFIKNKDFLFLLLEINQLIDINIVNLTEKNIISIDNKWIFNYEYSISENIQKCLKYYLNLFNFKVYKNNIYIKQENSEYTWIFYKNFYNFIDLLNLELVKDLDFINKYINLIYKIIDNADSYLFDNIDFEAFRYIEYKDFVIDCFNNKFIIFKKDLQNNIVTFKYYDIKFKDMRKKKFILQKILYNNAVSLQENNEIFYLFCRALGTFICSATPKKGEAIYLHGVPSSGKSVLTEEYFISLYTLNNIGLLNFSDKKYVIEQAIDKKIILINEYKHSSALRELMLKILDKSLIELNIKYKLNQMAQITGHAAIISNKSPIEQKFDEAMNVRLKSFSFFDSFLNKNVDYNVVIDEFPSLTCLYIYAFYNSQENFFYHNNTINIDYTVNHILLEAK